MSSEWESDSDKENGFELHQTIDGLYGCQTMLDFDGFT